MSGNIRPLVGHRCSMVESSCAVESVEREKKLNESDIKILANLLSLKGFNNPNLISEFL